MNLLLYFLSLVQLKRGVIEQLCGHLAFNQHQPTTTFDQVAPCLLLNSKYLQGGRLLCLCNPAPVFCYFYCDNHTGTCTVEMFLPDLKADCLLRAQGSLDLWKICDGKENLLLLSQSWSGTELKTYLVKKCNVK